MIEALKWLSRTITKPWRLVLPSKFDKEVSLLREHPRVKKVTKVDKARKEVSLLVDPLYIRNDDDTARKDIGPYEITLGPEIIGPLGKAIGAKALDRQKAPRHPHIEPGGFDGVICMYHVSEKVEGAWVQREVNQEFVELLKQYRYESVFDFALRAFEFTTSAASYLRVQKELEYKQEDGSWVLMENNARAERLAKARAAKQKAGF